MSFFSRLFKSKQPLTLEEKIAELKGLDQQQLIDRLNTSEPEAYNCAIIAHLAYCPTLVHHALNPQTSQQLKVAARKRLGTLLDQENLTVNTLNGDIKDQAVLLQICGYSGQAGMALVEQIDNANLLLEVAQSGSTTQIRQAAASKIEERGVLEQLVKRAQNKDKAVYKIVKNKLEIYKEIKAQEAQMTQEINAICNQAEQLTKRSIDDIFHARKLQIENAWNDFAEHASGQAKERFHSAMNICRQKLDEIQRHEQERIALKNAEKEAKKEVHDVLSAWQQLIARLFVQPTTEITRSEIADIELQQSKVFTDAQNQALSTHKEEQKAEELKNAAHSLFSTINEHGTLSQLIEQLKDASEDAGPAIKQRIIQLKQYSQYLIDAEKPEILGRSQQAIEAWNAKLKLQTQAIRDQLRKVSDLLRRGSGAVSAGHVGRSRAILRDLEDAKNAAGELPNHLAVKYESFKESINKLGDWHEFAVTPKKEALVEQMQSLVNSSLPPAPLADKIHKLQEQWKELCRGGQNQDENLWQEFHKASQEAYEPCKTFFEKQSQEREQNAEQRKTLITQLNEYLDAYDWSSADWKEVEKTLRIARDAWQSYWPVPRKDIKILQDEFDRLMDSLYAKLKAEHERNRLKKQAIVDQASKLLEHTDIQEAIESAKRLQSQWQAVGHCKRKDDQALWKAFRAHCDAIFEKRSQENEAQRDEREQAKMKALDLLQQLESKLDLKGQDYLDARADIDQINVEFKNIGELPRADSRAIFEHFNQLQESLQNKIREERHALVELQWQTVFTLADELRQLERTSISGADISEELGQFQQRMIEVKRWPADSQHQLEERLKNINALAQQDLDNSATQLRMLCIRSEIVNQLQTPEEDKALRMEYQVELLRNEGLGQATPAEDDQNMVEYLDLWLQQPGCEDNAYKNLLERFRKCWAIRV